MQHTPEGLSSENIQFWLMPLRRNVGECKQSNAVIWLHEFTPNIIGGLPIVCAGWSVFELRQILLPQSTRMIMPTTKTTPNVLKFVKNKSIKCNICTNLTALYQWSVSWTLKMWNSVMEVITHILDKLRCWFYKASDVLSKYIGVANKNFDFKEQNTIIASKHLQTIAIIKCIKIRSKNSFSR